MVVAEWLSILRAAPKGGVATLELGKSPVTKDDQKNLCSFLRYVRSCRAMVVAEVAAGASQLSVVDLIACLCTDVTTASDSQDTCKIEAFDSSGEIEDDIVRSMWLDAVSESSLEEIPYPKQVGDLRQVHLVSSEADVNAMRCNSNCMMSEFLLGFRRAGGIRLHAMDKGGFNYYWVTKAIMLEANARERRHGIEAKDSNASLSTCASEQDAIAEMLSYGNLIERRRARMLRAQKSALCKPISTSFDEERGFLTLTLHAEVLDMPIAEIFAQLSVWCKDKRVQRVHILLPGATAESLGRLIPKEVASGTTIAFKWYRKWDNLLSQFARLAPVHCEIRGPTAPALIELFFSSAVRIWSWDGADVGFQSSGFLPGPGFFAAHKGLGRAALRRLLLQGFSPTEALKLGVISSCNGGQGNSLALRPMQDPLATSPILTLLQNRHLWTTPTSSQGEQREVLANLVGISLTLPGKQHEMTQMEVCERLGLKGTNLQSIFEAEHIQTRTLAQLREQGYGYHTKEEITNGTEKTPPGQGALTQKHLRWARAMLCDAVRAACQDAGQLVSAVRYISISSSSGYLLPGLTAYVVNDLQLSPSTVRCDIIAMGCHAGLNSLQAATNWAALHPGKLAISCGVEVLSAHFMWNDQLALDKDDANRLNHALCNSLFSDGCFAVALVRPTSSLAPPCYATLHEFASRTVTDAMHTMTYQWSDVASQFWFYLSEEAPYAVGGALKQFLHEQQDEGVPMESILHYVVHTGGQTVIDAVAAAISLDDAELMATKSALKKFGNNSSASFMFAFGEFLELAPRPVEEGDLGAFITMGPGAGFEFCLWSAGARSSTEKQKGIERSILRRVADPPWDAGIIGNIKSSNVCLDPITNKKLACAYPDTSKAFRQESVCP
mmetsp:Transcript_102384/g.161763  ORF Transcript_102384/g.161763 Transcript_102384/m.161763 type:complete len:895 (+) Transcript_102384:97-2781(+)